MLEDLERQLDERHPTERAEAPEHSIASAQAPPPLSIADELRELQRTPEVPRRQGDHASPPATSTLAGTAPSREPGNPFPTASGIVDRNNDGRIDQWIFRENGEIAKEVLDEDFDGRPDRTLVFDPQTHRPSRVEEDTGGDGVLDSWTDYHNGAISRRRSDSTGFLDRLPQRRHLEKALGFKWRRDRGYLELLSRRRTHTSRTRYQR
jgi:hypothetical protein